MASKPRFIVVGGGLAGLMTVIKICEAGHECDLFSLVPVKRSHSVCAQGGINGAVNTMGEGDHPEIHFVDTVKGGDFLAHQPLCKAMCYAAPSVIYLLDRMGVMFNRTREGFLDFRRFGGTLHHRTAFAGATTGQQLLYALDEQVRRYEAEGLVNKYEHHEFLGPIKDDDGVCRGIVCVDMRSMRCQAFRGDATLLCVGGPGLVFGKSTQSFLNTGSAAGYAYMSGVKYANAEFIQIHPTAIPGEDKVRLMSESARGEGGRVWTYKDGKPWYFLEEKYPRFGNLVPRDVAAREIHHAVYDLKLGLDGKPMVHLDLSHIPADELDRKLGGILEIYEKFVGDDPRKKPMKIFPGVHYSMGGLWTDYERTVDGFIKNGSPRNHQTNIPGLFAVGEADYQYHGANRLGANSLLSCVYGGMIAGPAGVSYSDGLEKRAGDCDASLFDGAAKKWADRFEEIYRMDGPENPFKLNEELGEWMQENVTIVRYNDKLKATEEKVDELQERWKKCNVLDTGKWSNQPALFVNQLWNMMAIARSIVKCAFLRDECRGAHYKPDFLDKPPEDLKSPEYKEFLQRFADRNKKWLKSSIAEYAGDGESPKISYEAVDTSLVAPQPRRYD